MVAPSPLRRLASLAVLTAACGPATPLDTDPPAPSPPEPRVFGADDADVRLGGSHELFAAPGRIVWTYAHYWEGPAPMEDIWERSASGDEVVVWECDIEPGCVARDLTLVGDLDGSGTPWVAFWSGGTRMMPLDGQVRRATDEALPVIGDLGQGFPCGDISGDGVLDLCGDGSAWFGPIDPTAPLGPADRTWEPTSDAPHPVAVDLDGDGVNALFIPVVDGVSRVDPEVPPGAVDLASMPTWTGASTPRALVPADLDGDGRSELFVQVGSDVHVLDATFDAVAVVPVGRTLQAAGDLTGDGRAELVFGAWSTLWIAHADGTVVNHWVGDREDHPLNGTPELARGVQVADVDLDGQDDLVIAGEYGWGPGYVVFGPIEPDPAR